MTIDELDQTHDWIIDEFDFSTNNRFLTPTTFEFELCSTFKCMNCSLTKRIWNKTIWKEVGIIYYDCNNQCVDLMSCNEMIVLGILE